MRFASALTKGLPGAPLVSTSSAAVRSMPLRSIIETASASAEIWTPQTKLLISFTSAPLPAGPRWMMLWPIADNTGLAFSIAVEEPPTMKLSSPDAACALLPVTGASINSQPCAAAAADSSLIQSRVMVPHSMQSVPSNAVASAPFSPSHRLRDALSSASMLIITSAPEAASAGEDAMCAPFSPSALALSGLRL